MDIKNYPRAKLAIRNTFIELVKTDDIDKISVSKITRLANVSRGTFYLYFRDVHALYSSIEDELYFELEKAFDNFYINKETLDLFSLNNAIVNYIYENQDIFFITMKPLHSARTFKRLRNFCLERMIFKNLEGTTELQQHARAIFISSGFVGVLEEWLLGGLKVDKDEVCNNLNILISQIN